MSNQTFNQTVIFTCDPNEVMSFSDFLMEFMRNPFRALETRVLSGRNQIEMIFYREDYKDETIEMAEKYGLKAVAA